jgi:uncharacterized protein YciI
MTRAGELADESVKIALNGAGPAASWLGHPKRVVFVIEAEDSAAAKRQLAQLPLVAAGMFNVECLELRPFVNWSMLVAH